MDGAWSVMNFTVFKDWLVTGLLVCGLYILWDMKQSVDILNRQVAVVLEKSSWFEKYNEQQDRRLDKLEDRLKERK